MDIIIPIITLGALGALFGISLAVASKYLAVKVDHRLEMVAGLLPGSNCGACGGAGCFGFAEALLKGEADISSCRVSEDKARAKIAGILGKNFEQKQRLSAVVHCGGGNKVKGKYLYTGINDCVALNMVMGGNKQCASACLGLGSCVLACPFGAIKMSETALPVVDREKCRACAKCVERCPKKLFSLRVVLPAAVYVACSSKANPAEKRRACPVCCIACRKCEKVCKPGAIKVIDNLAVIDYEKCSSCGECIAVCPMKVIRRLQ